MGTTQPDLFLKPVAVSAAAPSAGRHRVGGANWPAENGVNRGAPILHSRPRTKATPLWLRIFGSECRKTKSRGDSTSKEGYFSRGGGVILAKQKRSLEY